MEWRGGQAGMHRLSGATLAAHGDSTINSLTNKPKQIRISDVKGNEIQRFTSWLGKRSYAARVKRLGIERIREIARENGKRGGRPPKRKE
jgi:hypothetical protein